MSSADASDVAQGQVAVLALDFSFFFFFIIGTRDFSGLSRGSEILHT